MTAHPLAAALRKPDPVTAEQVIAAHHFKAGTPVEVVMERIGQHIADLETLASGALDPKRAELYRDAAGIARRDLGVLRASERRAA